MSHKPRHYRLYDLVVATDAELALTPAADDRLDAPERIWRYERGDVELPGGRLIHDVEDFVGNCRLRVRTTADGSALSFSHGGTRVLWDGNRRRIRLRRGEQMKQGAGVMLERVVAPIALLVQRTDHVALHASAVADREGGGWLFVGDSGAGKSTTAVELMRRGLPILADDLVMIDAARRRLLVATPTVRLLDPPDTVPEAIDSHPVLPRRRKHWYRLADDLDRPRTAPLRGIVSLQPDDAADSPRLQRVHGREATVRLVGQAFDLTEARSDWRESRFRSLCELARNIPVYRLVYCPGDRAAPAQVGALAELLEWPS